MSKPSLAALRDAKTLAQKTGARLDLIYVQDLPLSLMGFGPDTGPGTAHELSLQMDDFAHWREEKLRETLKDMPRARVRVRTVRGWPPSTLAGLADGRGADFVVMGTHGYAGFDRAVFGSVAEAVVRRARVPVFIAHKNEKPLRISRILVPFNGQPYAERALVYALQWARSFRAKITVLYVEPEGLREPERAAAMRRQAQAILGHAARGARFVTRRGEAPHEIIREALSGGCSLIALAAHRRAFWSDFILGSTAERVLRHSPVPVLCVPSENKAAKKEGAA
jgi:nucleotide-binding universal stress UspA family protein